MPFLAVDGAHGYTVSLNKMKSGIAISFRRMKAIAVNGDGKSAQLDPGLTNGDVVRGLWRINKHAGEFAKSSLGGDADGSALE